MPLNENFILSKFIFPTSLKSEEIRIFWTEQLRKKALFSAQTTSKTYLDRVKELLLEFQKGIGKGTDPNGQPIKLSQDNVRMRTLMLEELEKQGLVLRDGSGAVVEQITNLGSKMRLDLIIRTNEALAQGEAKKMVAKDPLQKVLRPAWELVRFENRNHPRDWDKIWNECGNAVGWKGVARNTNRKVALIDSPIWNEIGHHGPSSLGVDCPPFFFNSGMDWVSVLRDDCIKLGLLDE